MNEVGDRLKTARERRGWSQGRLVQEAEALGVKWHQTTVYRFEAGTQQIRLLDAVAFAKIFGVSVDWVAGVEDEDAQAGDLYANGYEAGLADARNALANLGVAR